jgi:GxxExxY protein
MNKFLHNNTGADYRSRIAFLNRNPNDGVSCWSHESFYPNRPLAKQATTTETQRTQRLHREERAKDKSMSPHINRLTSEVIGSAIEVHRKLGPGLLESAYKECLCRELILRGVPFEKERPLPLEYKGIRLECGYRVDILAGGIVVVEVKSVEALSPIHDAQVLTYLRLGGWRVGLLINFNVIVLKDGIHRRILGDEN